MEPKLAEEIAQLAWLADGASSIEVSTIEQLASLAVSDAELGRVMLVLVSNVDLLFAQTVMGLPWVTDGTTEHEQWALNDLSSLAAQDMAHANRIAGLSWLIDGLSKQEGSDVSLLIGLAETDLVLGQSVLDFSWVYDGLSEDEHWMLTNIRGISERDVELARTIVAFSWLSDNPAQEQFNAISALRGLSENHPALARLIVGLPWVSDGLSEDEYWMLSDIRGMSDKDMELAAIVVRFPWISDTPSEDQFNAISALWGLSEENTVLAKDIIGLPWLADGFSHNEVSIVTDFKNLSEIDPDFAQRVGAYPWLVDGVSEYERWVAFDLHGLAKIDLDFARRVADFPWLSDSVSEIGRWAISNLVWVARADIGLARSTVDTPLIADADELTRVGADIIRLTLHPDRRAQSLEDDLKESPWYVDGVNEAEEMLLTTLGGVRASHRLLYEALIESYDLRTRTFSLPLAGEIRLWAFDPLTFREGENPLRDVEDVVRVTEAFMKEPFPASDIVVVTSYDKRYGGGAWHAGHYIFIARWGQVHLNKKTVYHEIGHYYFGGDIGPGWLVEGGATYVEAIVQVERREETLEERRRHVRRYMEQLCHANDLRNIQQLNAIQHRRISFGDACNYHMGEHFLIMLTLTIGIEPVSAALQDLYVQGRTTGKPATEEEIYRTFLKHTPPELEIAVSRTVQAASRCDIRLGFHVGP